MKNGLNLVISNVVTLALAVTLIVFYNADGLERAITVVLGCLFALPSLFSLYMLLFSGRAAGQAAYNPRYNLLPVIGGLCFGLMLVFRADVFVPMLRYLFAALLMLAGLYYVFYLVMGRGRVRVPGWYYVLPSLVTVAGFVVLAMPVESNAVIFLLTGVSLVAVTLTSVLVALAERALARAGADGTKNEELGERSEE